MGKIFQKKWFRGRHTTEEERRKKKVWPINHITINHHHGESVAGRLESAVRHAARVRRRAFVERMMRTTTSTTTIVFRRRLFFFVFLFFLPRARIIIFIVVFVSLFFSCVVCLRIVCVACCLWCFLERSDAWPKPSVEWGVDALLGWAFEETRAF